jgi:hypothetical protein
MEAQGPLQRAAQSSLQSVETLVSRWKEETEKAGVAVSLTDADLAERVRDSLATVTSALEQAMPRTKRQQGTARLWIRFAETEQDATFGWLDGPEEGEPIRLFTLIHHRLGFVGDFEGMGLDLLARCAVRGLQEGWTALPRFTLTSRHGADLLLTWNKPGL